MPPYRIIFFLTRTVSSRNGNDDAAFSGKDVRRSQRLAEYRRQNIIRM